MLADVDEEQKSHDILSAQKDSPLFAPTPPSTPPSPSTTTPFPHHKDPGPPPDGGTAAWTQACMGHLMVINTWGYVAAYGVFETYYTATLPQSASDIAWIGSTQIFLLFFIGTFSGRALDAGWFRTVYITGIFFELLGIFMTSVSTKYWHFFLAQGVCTGIGNGLQFCPAMALVNTWFSSHKFFALTIASCGSTTGGVILPLLVRELLPRIGFGWTIRVLGFVIMATSAVSLAFFRTRLPPREAGPVVEWAAFKEVPYALVCVGMFLNMWAMYFAFYYVGSYGRDRIGLSYADSINLLMLMNGIGFFGRVIPGALADLKLGALNTITPVSIATGAVVLGWIGVDSVGGIYVFACLYGFIGGGVQSMFPPALSSMTTDLSKSGVRLGMGFTVVSFATLTGSPLGGALIQLHKGNYLYAQIWAGLCLICGGLTLFAARIARTGWKPFRQRV